MYQAAPLEENLFEWHFTVRGPGDTDFQVSPPPPPDPIHQDDPDHDPINLDNLVLLRAECTMAGCSCPQSTP